MANFELAYKTTLENEGGYVNDPNDSGGETYKGISRNNWSKWEGWTKIDIAKTKPGFPNNLNIESDVFEFYQVNFWNRLRADQIENQQIAESIFDFAVNAGIGTAVSLAQMVVGAKSDGVIGPITIEAINKYNPELFLAEFTLAKIARYVSIVKRRPENKKYFYSWIVRTLKS